MNFYFLVHENIEQGDWMVVTKEVDGTFWFGKVMFHESDFDEIHPLPGLVDRIKEAVAAENNLMEMMNGK